MWLIKLSSTNLARTLPKEEATVALSRPVSTTMSLVLIKLCILSGDVATVVFSNPVSNTVSSGLMKFSRMVLARTLLNNTPVSTTVSLG